MKFIKIALIFAVAITASIVFFFTNINDDLESVAASFFQESKENNFISAYAKTSEKFHRGVSLSEFQEFISILDLKNARHIDWTLAKVQYNSNDKDEARLIGKFYDINEQAFQLILDFILVGNIWKIQSIEKPESVIDVDGKAFAHLVPSEDRIILLTKNTFKLVCKGVLDKNFSSLYESTSIAFQNQFSFDQLNKGMLQTHASTLEQDCHIFNDLKLVFSEKPKLKKDGTLDLVGYYQSPSVKYKFSNNYVYEGIGWKLLGLG